LYALSLRGRIDISPLFGGKCFPGEDRGMDEACSSAGDEERKGVKNNAEGKKAKERKALFQESHQ